MKSVKFTLPILALTLGCTSLLAENALRRDGWTFDRSQIEWEHPATDPAAQKKAGTLKSLVGWAEYDFEVGKTGWYELWATGIPADWNHDVFVDGKLELWLTNSDAEKDADPARKGWFKEANFFLTQGRHTIRFRRLNYPGGLPSAWELRPSGGQAESSLRIVDGGNQAVRVSDTVKLKFEGGAAQPLKYELVASGNGGLTSLAQLEFPAADKPVEKTVEVQFPKQGVFEILAWVNGKLLRPADLHGGDFAVVDTKQVAPPAAELKTTTIVDIDCTAAPPATGFWEKDGKTEVKESPAGRYRESSGQGSAQHWGTDGFSYRFDLPDTNQLYRLRVDYPDDDRRSMGFWINDGADVRPNHLGVTNGGGVETGDHYPLTKKMATHEAYFYPRENKDLIVAVVNLVPGLKAAAARIRIDRVDSGLPAAPLGETHGRTMGFYFEENGRWLRFFGGDSRDVSEEFKTLERWGQWNRYLGANLMFPTINVYQGNNFPSRVLEGYFVTRFNETRLAALMAEKYHCEFVPEFHLSGQRWFDKYLMGVWADKADGLMNPVPQLKFASKEAEERIARDRSGSYAFGVKPFGYNALHPAVQKMYIDALGELADQLADCSSFTGISSRMMLSWQYQGWNTLAGLNWGYDDWTVAQFSKDTGLAVPGQAGSTSRFRERFDYLTGPALDAWLKWRCEKIFDFHKRLLARIQKAKPGAKLFFTYTRTDPKSLYSPDLRIQLLHAGVDLKLYANEPDIVFLPTAMYGRRYSTPIGDAEVLEAINQPSTKAIAGSGLRAISLFSNYYEVNAHLDWSKLGGKTYAAFDACVPSGINERELYAMALADSDCSFIASGGNGWIFGNAEVMQPFLREYRALPAQPFSRFAKASDPVAVWQYRDPQGTLWFYVVNRLPVCVQVSLTASGQVTPAAGGDPVDLARSFVLEPFMMRSFRTTGELSDCQVTTPPEYIASLQTKIAGAQKYREDLLARRIVPEMTSEEVASAGDQLQAAITAFAAGQYGAAYRELERLALVRTEYASGHYLPGVLQRSEPLGVRCFSDVLPNGFQVVRADPLDQISTPLALVYDAEGNLWVGAEGRAVKFGSDGKWLQNVPLFEPFSFDRREKFDRGDIREAALYAPTAFTPSALALAPDHNLIAQRGTAAPVVFNELDGRARRLSLADRFNIGGPCALLATLPDGKSLVATANGVSEYALDGTWIRQISAQPAIAGAVDKQGHIYLAERTGLRVLDAAGKTLATLPEIGVESLATTQDGSLLFALKDQGRSLVCYHQEGNSYAQAWKEVLPAVSTLSASPQGRLAVALAQPDNGVSVRDYAPTAQSLGAARDLVRAIPEISPGFTALKVYGGRAYYLAQGKLFAITPGANGQADTVKMALDPKLSGAKASAFAFAPNGDLFLAANGKGALLFRCKKTPDGWAPAEPLHGGKPVSEAILTDLAVDRDGKVIIRQKDSDAGKAANLTLFRWSEGQPPAKLADLGKSEVSEGEYGLAVGGDGSVYVASGNLHGVQKYAPTGETVWQSLRQKTAPPGYVDLRCPLGIAVDSSDRVWATDPTRHQVLGFDKDGQYQRTLGSFGDGRDPARLSLNQPTGVTVLKDASGREWLYVADSGNGRVVKWPLVP